MAIICRKYNLLFIMTPRTASTAIGKVLCDELGGEFLPEKDILDSRGYNKVPKKHSTLAQLIGERLISKEEASSLLKFTCVRDPFDSLVSLYLKKRNKYQALVGDRKSFLYRTPGFAKDLKFCKKHSFNAWIFRYYGPAAILRKVVGYKLSLYEKYTAGMDEIIRYENLQKDFHDILKKADITAHLPAVPCVNVTMSKNKEGGKPRQYYNKISRKIVEYVFRDDLDRFGYKF